MQHKKMLFAGMILGAALLGGIMWVRVSGAYFPPDPTIEIVMRQVGHKVLLAAGDSSTRVMPLTRTSDNAYLLRFEAPLTFNSDTLVKVIDSTLSAEMSPEKENKSYIVNVISCAAEEVVYGYKISGGLSGRRTIVPCVGREQPRGCYMIAITFDAPPRLFASNWSIAIFLFTGALLVSLLLIRRRTPVKKQSMEQKTEMVLGNYRFYPESHVLYHPDSSVTLTAKETRLMFLFASRPNEILLRDKLLKDVWEDDGVFVGRSLDMFISRLRKKLQLDSSVRLVNIHGRGYRLEVD